MKKGDCLMKIIGLNGSPRRQNSRTGQLVKEILDSAAEHGAQTRYFDITGLKIKPCLACDKCHKKGYCVQKDDFQFTFDEIMSADGFILGSPVYIYQVTAQLKNWIDRLANTIHCLRFQGKYGATVATAGGSGEKETADYMEKILRYTGMQVVGSLAYCLEEDGLLDNGSPVMNEARHLGHSLVNAVREKQIFTDQLEEFEQRKVYFRQLMNKRKDKWNWEYDYWKEKGWL
jgi:multimeric flavodoxin WrbA